MIKIIIFFLINELNLRMEEFLENKFNSENNGKCGHINFEVERLIKEGKINFSNTINTVKLQDNHLSSKKPNEINIYGYLNKTPLLESVYWRHTKY